MGFPRQLGNRFIGITRLLTGALEAAEHYKTALHQFLFPGCFRGLWSYANYDKGHCGHAPTFPN